MPISLNKIANNVANVSFVYDSETVNFSYYPARITEKTFAQLQSLESMSNIEDINTGFAALNSMLAQLIKKWDVYEDDAQTVVYPLEAARLADLPIMFRMQVLGTILRDFRPEALMPQTLN